MNLITDQKGQSTIELLVAIGIFVMIISSISFLILDSYVSGRLGKEITQAIFLAEEGLEAVRSIRDNSWDNLYTGSHGLAISGNNWVFQGNQEDVSWQLKEGIREITVGDVDSDRKQIISEVTWDFTETRPQQIKLITYLTNWQKVGIPPGYCVGTPSACDQFLDQGSCQGQDGCSWLDAYCGGDCTSCSGLDRTQCNQQDGCSWFLFFCLGTCTSCDNFDEQPSCEEQLGCSWNPGTCSGTPVSCDTYTTPEDCEAQEGCYWAIP